MIHYTPMQYMQIEVANSFGLDKELFETRYQWTIDNDAELENLASEADDECLYWSAVINYRKAQQGIPTGATVGLDGTYSGGQMIAALLGCEITAEACNLVDPDVRHDPYTDATNKMNKLLLGIVQVNVSRHNMKYCLMPWTYGSSSVPKELFGEDTMELRAFYQTVQEDFPACWNYLHIMQGRWDESAYFNQWSYPDGHVAHVKVIRSDDVKCQIKGLGYFTHIVTSNNPKEAWEKGAKSLIANPIQGTDAFVVAEMVRRCAYDPADVMYSLRIITDEIEKRGLSLDTPTDNTEFLATNFCTDIDPMYVQHYNDNALLRIHQRLTFLSSHRPFYITHVHDKFNAHANNCNRMREHYCHILADICESNMFETIFKEITGRAITLTKDAGLADKIRYQSNYAIC